MILWGLYDMIGKLIVFEGTDGCGKSTLCKKTKEYLESLGKKTEVIALPYEQSMLYSQIRDILKTNSVSPDIIQSMMIANMKDCINTKVVHLLSQGINVILDRWLLSTIIYSILGNGHICESMAINYNCHHTDSLKTYFRPTIDLEFASKNFVECDVYPNKIFYIVPPTDLLISHAKARAAMKDVEFNDTNIEGIITSNNLYFDMYMAINENLVDFNGYHIIDSTSTFTSECNHILVSANQKSENLSESDLYKVFQDQIFTSIDTLMGIDIACDN